MHKITAWTGFYSFVYDVCSQVDMCVYMCIYTHLYN